MTEFRPVRDYVVSDPAQADTSITAGDAVRSYDWEHRDDCFVDGVVKGVTMMEGCDRYEIVPARKMIGDREITGGDLAPAYYPPVNGTCYAGRDGFTNFVRKLGA